MNVQGAALVCFSFRVAVSGLPNALKLELGRNSMKITDFLWFYFIALPNYTKATVQGLVQPLAIWNGKARSTAEIRSELLDKANRTQKMRGFAPNLSATFVYNTKYFKKKVKPPMSV